ncbi:choice-of-anchor Q domain-containing protein [Leptolyngbya sp. CCNP1308]|uniref:Ig-like domain-containing protein n=1 Tax=Leptolyngbya sp. CCNP1308 TaxID=3110255 RepID=UPI002B20E23D|nr:choice-of-anchor Q domain-containing protein [Leptolyngbya sp. CCNP1308]MEA5449219.1 choice-of-anchor Q domain-containing protein [Leptolyngbya sp. CCNP1308]
MADNANSASNPRPFGLKLNSLIQALGDRPFQLDLTHEPELECVENDDLSSVLDLSLPGNGTILPPSLNSLDLSTWEHPAGATGGRPDTPSLTQPGLVPDTVVKAIVGSTINQGAAALLAGKNGAPLPFIVTSLADTVDANDGVLTLREAVLAANAQQGADEISFAPGLSGTLTLSGTQITITDALTIHGAEGGAIALSGNQASRIFTIARQAPVTLNHLTLTQGFALDGGAILTNSDLTLNHCVFIGNVGQRVGGAVYSDTPGTLKVSDSTFKHNQASHGGGIWARAIEAAVTNSTFESNVARVGGGAIEAILGRAGTIENSQFYNNEAIYGGGITQSFMGTGSKTFTVNNSTFSGNRAERWGGGIGTLYLYLDVPDFQRDLNAVVIQNTTFNANEAGEKGGGIFLDKSNTKLTNATFTQNSALEGGGIFNTSKLTVTNSTIANNGAIRGGGISTTYQAEVGHSIIATNGTESIPSVAADLDGEFFTRGHNLIGIGQDKPGFVHGLKGDQVGTWFSPLDPKLGPLQDNGGPTQTMALLPGSSAIDAVRSPFFPATDQRGIARKRGYADIGAVEYGHRPVAQDDAATVMEGASVELAVLSNDTDGDGDALTIAAFTQPTHGTLQQNLNGTLTYTAALNFSGPDTFTYQVSDGVEGTSHPATVTILVSPLALDGTREADTLIGTDTDNSINGRAGNDWLYGQGGNDILRGGAGDDQVFGGEGNDRLYGDAEDDMLYGGAGDDWLNGGSQNDVLVGGPGRDLLIGGTGDDRYVYTALDDAGDTIQDFMNGNDVLDLRDLFGQLNYSGTDPIADNYLQFVFSGGRTEVQVSPDGTAEFTPLVTLNGIAPDQLVLGQNLLV